MGDKVTMNKYNEVEIQTAKNLLKCGYKWIVRYETGRLFAHFAKPFKSKVNNVWGSVGFSTSVCDFVPIFQSIRFDDKEPTSLEAIVHPQILDDVERRYLSTVIKPFKNQVRSIVKHSSSINSGKEYLAIITDGCWMMFPEFEASTIYKGMKIGKMYTLEELGL